MPTPAEIYAMPAQSVSKDLSALGGCSHMHVDELQELGFYRDKLETVSPPPSYRFTP